MLDGDFPFYYAQIPGAAAALRAGDKTPLLRLAATHPDTVEGSDAGSARDFSQAASLFRACVDDDNAWDESAWPAERRQQVRRCARRRGRYFGLLQQERLGEAATSGVPAEPVYHQDLDPPVAVGLPGAKEDDVPTLILTGDMDNGLSTQISRQVTHVLTDSRLVEVEQAGHNPWFWRSCARQMVRAFIRTGARDDLCAWAGRSRSGGILAQIPRRLGDIAAARPRPGDESTLEGDRRLATATVWTLLDAIQLLLRSETSHGRGLRGGKTSAVFSSRATRRPDHYRLKRAKRFTKAVRAHREGLLGTTKTASIQPLPPPNHRSLEPQSPSARALVPRQLRVPSWSVAPSTGNTSLSGYRPHDFAQPPTADPEIG